MYDKERYQPHVKEAWNQQMFGFFCFKKILKLLFHCQNSCQKQLIVSTLLTMNNPIVLQQSIWWGQFKDISFGLAWVMWKTTESSTLENNPQHFDIVGSHHSGSEPKVCTTGLQYYVNTDTLSALGIFHLCFPVITMSDGVNTLVF